uniref:Glyco_hydro_65N domain-containing protein n=1 Tax=Panagrellus redivivus TaxID=6233 RepID=A0A7E4W4V1_PANRE
MANTEPASARLCCNLKFRPYQNRTFTALKLGAPSTFAVLQYSAFSWVEGRWSEEDKRTIRFNVDGNMLNQFMDSAHNYKLSLNTLGKSANALNAGMYFVENLPHGNYGEIAAQPLNEITDYNVERLGWYRQDDNGQFYISSGSMMIDKMHRAKAENCKDQKYLSVLDANYYINKDWNDSTKFDLADSLRSTFLWIKKARVHDSDERHVVVTANEGATIEVTLTAAVSDHLTFVHNASKLEDFAGKIVIDSRSNSVMRLSVINATGILNGYIRHIEDHKSVHIDSFSVHVPEGEATTKSVEVRIKPYTAHTYHMVCLQPEDGMDELCRPVEAVVEARSVPEMSKSWTEDHSNCPECNQITLDGIMKYLNPVAWVNNVSSLTDGVVLIVQVVMFGVVLFLLYSILSKCVYPLLKCCICPGKQCINIIKK